MSRLQVVDPHFHVWDLSTGYYPHFEPGPDTDQTLPTARSYLMDEYLGEGGAEVEVIKAVFVEAIPRDPLGEARFVHSVATDSPVPIGIVARADLSAPDAKDQLAALADLPSVKGIRQILNRHVDPALNYVDADFMEMAAWLEGFSALARHGFSFDLQIYPHQMPRAAEIAAAHPDVPIVLNHAGMWADRTSSGWREWRDGLRLLAQRPNVSVKISGLGMLDADWTPGSIRPLVYEVLDAFGSDRAMFASNFPVDKPGTSFALLWQAFDRLVSDLPETDRAALFQSNAERIYRI